MKKHKMLMDLEQQLSGIRKTTEVKLAGKTWKLRVLDRKEEMMAQDLVQSESIIAAFANSTVPQLALALESVDGVSVKELFEPDTPEDRKTHQANPELWTGMQVAAWLADQPTTFVTTLWQGYLSARQSSMKSLEEMENFSERTPSGD